LGQLRHPNSNSPCSICIQIFNEQPETGQPNLGSSNNAIVVVQLNEKVSIDLNDPGKPPQGTVNNGYNESLDRPRPGYLHQYLEFVFVLFSIRVLFIYNRDYNIIFIIDDSGSVNSDVFPLSIIFSDASDI
jgi:hypothetical protein